MKPLTRPGLGFTLFPWQTETRISEAEFEAWEHLRGAIGEGVDMGFIPETERDGLFTLLQAMFEHDMRSPFDLTVGELIIVNQDVAEA
jgi:hypothetical protein